MTKIRVTKKLMANLKVMAETLGITVEQAKQMKPLLESIKQRFNTPSMCLNHRKEATAFYLGEGDRYWILFPNQKPVFVEMGSEFTLGASGQSWEIGQSITMPGGSVVVTVSYLGGYHLSLDVYDKIQIPIFA